MMPSYHIGTLNDAGKLALSEGETQSGAAPINERPTFLQPRTWTKAVLHSKKTVSWDTRVFTFKLEHEEQTLGLPVGQHLMIRLRDPVTREAIIRSYTPVSEVSDKGYLHVLVKVYFDTKEAKGGKMSQAMESLPIGHGVDFKGPIGKFKYHGHGRCSINDVDRHVKSLLMICAGSGITPIYQVFRAAMQDPEDNTRCVVLDGNRLVEDILMKEDMDALSLNNDHRCKVVYTLTQGTEEWKGLKGRVNGALVKEHCEKDDDTLVLICGPDALEKSIHQALTQDGWKDDQLVFF